MKYNWSKVIIKLIDVMSNEKIRTSPKLLEKQVRLLNIMNNIDDKKIRNK